MEMTPGFSNEAVKALVRDILRLFVGHGRTMSWAALAEATFDGDGTVETWERRLRSYVEADGPLMPLDVSMRVFSVLPSAAYQRLSENGKKELTEQDYQTLFKRATREVPTTTWYGGASSRPIYDMDAGNIPDATRKKIEDSYRRTYGKDPTEEQVADYWRRFYAK